MTLPGMVAALCVVLLIPAALQALQALRPRKGREWAPERRRGSRRA